MENKVFNKITKIECLQTKKFYKLRWKKRTKQQKKEANKKQ